MRDYLIGCTSPQPGYTLASLGNLKKKWLSWPLPRQIQSETPGLESGISSFRSFPGDSKVSSEKITDLITPQFSDERPKLQGKWVKGELSKTRVCSTPRPQSFHNRAPDLRTSPFLFHKPPDMSHRNNERFCYGRNLIRGRSLIRPDLILKSNWSLILSKWFPYIFPLFSIF